MKVIKLRKMLHLKIMYHLDCTLIDNAEDLDVVIRMYNLLEYSHHFSMTSGSL